MGSNNTTIKIAVVTGSRADYGLLVPLLKLLKNDSEVDLQLIVCSAHLSPEFGLTKTFIEADGFKISAEIEMLLSADTPSAISKSIGLGCIGFGDSFNRLRPDLLVLLGDRFETLAAAQVAMISQIPIAHLHGGETTQGAMDEAIRHSITKMSHLHFVAADEFRNRVIQLGENPERVYNVGAIGLDNINDSQIMNRSEISEALGLDIHGPLFLVTYHPVTLSQKNQQVALNNMLSATELWPDASIVITYANSDTFGRALIDEINAYAATRQDKVLVRATLGQKLYFSTMHHADCVIGNSSSGLIEAPSLGVPTVNIGSRQQGRLRGPSVIDCSESHDAIAAAIQKALSDEFKAVVRKKENPYYQGNTAQKIYQQLAHVNLDGVLMKKFFDIDNVETR